MELELHTVKVLDKDIQEGNPVERLFNRPEVSLQQLLTIDDLISVAKDVDAQFFQKLLKHTEIVKELMDCAMRPDKLDIAVMPLEWPYLAAQFLHCQQEEFFKSFFSPPKDDEVQQDSGNTTTQGSVLLRWLFKILDQPKPLCETSAGYLLRIFLQIYYQNQQEFFQYFCHDEQVLNKCVGHAYDTSIMEIIWRIIDTYNEDLDNKSRMVSKIFVSLAHRGQQQVDALENVEYLMENLIARTEEINTRKFSVQLCREVVNSDNIGHIRKLVSTKEPVNRVVLRHVTSILAQFMRFFILQKNPKKDIFKMDSSVQFVSVTEDLMREAISFTRLLFNRWFRGFCKTNLKQSKYVPIALLHSVVKLKPSSCEDLIFQEFIDLIIRLMKNQPLNNILHNEIKGILLVAFETAAVKHIITPQLLVFIIISFSAPPGKEPCYLNQLFYIAKAVQQKIDKKNYKKQIIVEWEEFIKGRYNARKVLYQSSIALEPSTKKDFFTWQSEVESEEGEESAGVIVIKKHSVEDLSFPMDEKVRMPESFVGLQMNISDVSG